MSSDCLERYAILLSVQCVFMYFLNLLMLMIVINSSLLPVSQCVRAFLTVLICVLLILTAGAIRPTSMMRASLYSLITPIISVIQFCAFISVLLMTSSCELGHLNMNVPGEMALPDMMVAKPLCDNKTLSADQDNDKTSNGAIYNKLGLNRDLENLSGPTMVHSHIQPHNTSKEFVKYPGLETLEKFLTYLSATVKKWLTYLDATVQTHGKRQPREIRSNNLDSKLDKKEETVFETSVRSIVEILRHKVQEYFEKQRSKVSFGNDLRFKNSERKSSAKNLPTSRLGLLVRAKTDQGIISENPSTEKATERKQYENISFLIRVKRAQPINTTTTETKTTETTTTQKTTTDETEESDKEDESENPFGDVLLGLPAVGLLIIFLAFLIFFIYAFLISLSFYRVLKKYNEASEGPCETDNDYNCTEDV